MSIPGKPESKEDKTETLFDVFKQTNKDSELAARVERLLKDNPKIDLAAFDEAESRLDLYKTNIFHLAYINNWPLVQVVLLKEAWKRKQQNLLLTLNCDKSLPLQLGERQKNLDLYFAEQAKLLKLLKVEFSGKFYPKDSAGVFERAVCFLATLQQKKNKDYYKYIVIFQKIMQLLDIHAKDPTNDKIILNLAEIIIFTFHRLNKSKDAFLFFLSPLYVAPLIDNPSDDTNKEQKTPTKPTILSQYKSFIELLSKDSALNTAFNTLMRQDKNYPAPTSIAEGLKARVESQSSNSSKPHENSVTPTSDAASSQSQLRL